MKEQLLNGLNVMNELILDGLEKKYESISCLEETHMTCCVSVVGF